MLSERKTNTIFFHLCEVPKVIKLSEIESSMVVVMGWWGEGKEELLFHGYRVLVLQDEVL